MLLRVVEQREPPGSGPSRCPRWADDTDGVSALLRQRRDWTKTEEGDFSTISTRGRARGKLALPSQEGLNSVPVSQVRERTASGPAGGIRPVGSVVRSRIARESRAEPPLTPSG